MRTLALILAATLIAAPALAAEFSVSRQSFEMTTMFGFPPPAGATALPDRGGETWLYENNGVLMLTAKTTGGIGGWARFEIGRFASWGPIEEIKGKPVLAVIRDGKPGRVTFDLRKVHDKRTLKFSVQ
jgi:hypothetical protein